MSLHLHKPPLKPNIATNSINESPKLSFYELVSTVCFLKCNSLYHAHKHRNFSRFFTNHNHQESTSDHNTLIYQWYPNFYTLLYEIVFFFAKLCTLPDLELYTWLLWSTISTSSSLATFVSSSLNRLTFDRHTSLKMKNIHSSI